MAFLMSFLRYLINIFLDTWTKELLLYFKKFLILFIVFLIHLKPVLTQCPTEERIELCSQDEVQFFAHLYPKCKRIKGDLIISLEVEDLSPIQGIQEIEGDLEIYDTDSLFNLDGLDSLSRVGGDLRIAVNLRLVDMGALSSLTEIGGGLYIYQHYNNIDSLTHINGLRNLRKVGRFISIRNNVYLSNVDGLSGLTEIPEDLRIMSNQSLKNIEGLKNLRRIGGHLRLVDLKVLQDLNGLRNLQEVGDQTTLMGLSAIVDLKPLSNLKTLGGKLQINLNPQLASLEGIDHINHWTISELIIRDNIRLDYCHVKSICDWISHRLAQPYAIDHNLGSCDSYPLIEGACQSVNNEDLNYDQKSISIFPNPASDKVSIVLPDNQSYSTIDLLDCPGRILLSIYVPAATRPISVDLHTLPPGLYYIRFMDQKRSTVIQKLIVE